ncbi:WxL domain-containing protein [Lactococcus fujiensis]|uniref:WxL domain-containing protein n=2 Tax=Lactococcus fujiensis TaxID=610251 RepID=A0A2A5RQ95_9LACT|nr:WxL domain-containing protein [Lactococcus fujiensis]PCS01596.1 hypothetical protein RT41_GL000360 [Lactococcus fujiensis JCM 16395]
MKKSLKVASLSTIALTVLAMGASVASADTFATPVTTTTSTGNTTPVSLTFASGNLQLTTAPSFATTSSLSILSSSSAETYAVPAGTTTPAIGVTDMTGGTTGWTVSAQASTLTGSGLTTIGAGNYLTLTMGTLTASGTASKISAATTATQLTTDGATTVPVLTASDDSNQTVSQAVTSATLNTGVGQVVNAGTYAGTITWTLAAAAGTVK